jgi:cation transport protein ChaC
MRLSAEHLRLVHRDIDDPGPIPGYAAMEDADYRDLTDRVLAERPPGPIAIFSYGSLIWRPAFAPQASLRATAPGWQRRFCLHLLRWRGTHEEPGLMMQIDRGGVCTGVLQYMDPAEEAATLDLLWRREMSIKPPSNLPRWIEVETPEGPRQAIAFTANHESPFHVGDLGTDETVRRLSLACGHLGSGAEYLYETVTALAGHGIEDVYLWNLQELVARAIEARYPDALARGPGAAY